MSKTGDNVIRKELIEMVSELNELIERGIIIDKSDFNKWLINSRTGCISCYGELSAIVGTYMKFI